ncbi:Epimerase domain-containing protein [Citrus sinensis]|nr:Epimerase domain-containing protein [Citrus sinensis]
MAAHNVLEACAQTNTVDKVVFTSSLTAVVWSNHRDNPTDVNLCKKFKLWHGLSKTLAEKTAWALAMDRGLSMVSINGGLVMGPDVTISNPYLKGAAEMYEDGVMASVDLRFYVDAHICVFEDVSSYGDTRVHPQRVSNKKLNKLMVNFDGEFQADCSAD